MAGNARPGSSVPFKSGPVTVPLMIGSTTRTPPGIEIGFAAGPRLSKAVKAYVVLKVVVAAAAAVAKLRVVPSFIVDGLSADADSTSYTSVAQHALHGLACYLLRLPCIKPVSSRIDNGTSNSDTMFLAIRWPTLVEI